MAAQQPIIIIIIIIIINIIIIISGPNGTSIHHSKLYAKMSYKSKKPTPTPTDLIK